MLSPSYTAKTNHNRVPEPAGPPEQPWKESSPSIRALDRGPYFIEAPPPAYVPSKRAPLSPSSPDFGHFIWCRRCFTS